MWPEEQSTTFHYFRKTFDSTSHDSNYILIPQSTLGKDSVSIVKVTEQGKERYVFLIFVILFAAFLNELNGRIKKGHLQSLWKARKLDISQAPLENRKKISVALVIESIKKKGKSDGVKFNKGKYKSSTFE